MKTIVKLSAILPLAFATNLAFSESCDRYADPNLRLKCEKMKNADILSVFQVPKPLIVYWGKGPSGQSIQICLDPDTYLQVSCNQ